MDTALCVLQIMWREWSLQLLKNSLLGIHVEDFISIPLGEAHNLNWLGTES